jgi:hypothetical protein
MSDTLSPIVSQDSAPTELQKTAYDLFNCVYTDLVDTVKAAKTTAARDKREDTSKSLDTLENALWHLREVAVVKIGGKQDVYEAMSCDWRRMADTALTKIPVFQGTATHPVDRLSRALATCVVQSVNEPDKPTW